MKRMLPLAASLAFLGAMTACESEKITAPTTDGVEDQEVNVPTPEEAKAEADRTIDEANADEVFEQLQAEIEADLEDGG